MMNDDAEKNHLSSLLMENLKYLDIYLIYYLGKLVIVIKDSPLFSNWEASSLLSLILVSTIFKCANVPPYGFPGVPSIIYAPYSGLHNDLTPSGFSSSFLFNSVRISCALRLTLASFFSSLNFTIMYSTSSPHFRTSPCRSRRRLYRFINWIIPCWRTCSASFFVSSQFRGLPSLSKPITVTEKLLVTSFCGKCVNTNL